MKQFLFFLAISLSTVSSYNNVSATSLAEFINQNAKEVRSGSDTYRQTVAIDASKNNLATLNIKHTNSKGQKLTQKIVVK